LTLIFKALALELPLELAPCSDSLRLVARPCNVLAVAKVKCSRETGTVAVHLPFTLAAPISIRLVLHRAVLCVRTSTYIRLTVAIRITNVLLPQRVLYVKRCTRQAFLLEFRAMAVVQPASQFTLSLQPAPWQELVSAALAAVPAFAAARTVVEAAMTLLPFAVTLCHVLGPFYGSPTDAEACRARALQVVSVLAAVRAAACTSACTLARTSACTLAQAAGDGAFHVQRMLDLVQRGAVRWGMYADAAHGTGTQQCTGGEHILHMDVLRAACAAAVRNAQAWVQTVQDYESNARDALSRLVYVTCQLNTSPAGQVRSLAPPRKTFAVSSETAQSGPLNTSGQPGPLNTSGQPGPLNTSGQSGPVCLPERAATESAALAEARCAVEQARRAACRAFANAWAFKVLVEGAVVSDHGASAPKIGHASVLRAHVVETCAPPARSDAPLGAPQASSGAPLTPSDALVKAAEWVNEEGVRRAKSVQ
jgi:hypothetical protein